jgi:hypothetical protein
MVDTLMSSEIGVVSFYRDNKQNRVFVATRFLHVLYTILFAPEEFNFAKAHHIARFDASFL